MRIPRLIRFALLVPMLISAGCHTDSPPPDLIVTGVFHTLNTEQPEVEAVAITNGRFSYVGNQEQALERRGPQTQIIELGERVAYPGFIDAHLHVAGIGAAQRAVNLSGAEDFADIIARIAERASTLREGVTITGHGWHQSKWQRPPSDGVDGFPTHQALSGAVPSHPVILEHANGHSVLLNQAAMDQVGITTSTVAPEGGVVVMHDGEPTGLLHETAIKLAAPLQAYDQQTAEELIDLAQQHLLSQGITTAHDAGALQVDLAAQRAMAERGALGIRLYSMVLASDEAALAEWLGLGPLLNGGDDKLTVRAIKVQADGALGSRTALLHAPYSDAPHTSGVLTYDLEALAALIERSRPDGWQINVHAIGDRANSEVLRVFAPFTQASSDHRFRIEHAQHLKLGDAQQFADQNVIASMQPIHLSSDRPWAIDRLGQQRIDEGAYIWRDLLNHGVLVASGTDAPVEPVNPIANFYAAVTRKTLQGIPEGGFEAHQKLTRLEALQAMTLAAAFAGFEEDVKGSIEVGKWADMTVLSQDILTVPESSILETKVALTMVGGEVLYEADLDAPESGNL